MLTAPARWLLRNPARPAAATVARARRPFGLEWMRDYLPHFLTCAPSRLHLDLADDLAESDLSRGNRLNRIAPRGAAKTTWMTTGHGLHGALSGAERFTLVTSETGPQAKNFLRSILDEVENNPAIARDYPEAAGRGPVWQADWAVLNNGVALCARGAGGRVRGLKHGSYRPTRVIADDVNEVADAYSPTKRQRKWDWFTRDLMQCGSPGTNYYVAGTPIHRGAVCYRLAETPGWRSKSYRSLDSYPERMDLWLEWERVLTNLANPEREAEARAIYESRRAEMDAGAVVLWPEREPLYDLMLIRAANGQGAFDSEKQDKPGQDGAAEFPADWIDSCPWFDAPPETPVYVGVFLDPSKGGTSTKADYHAIVTIWVTADGMVWLDADMKREAVPSAARRLVSRVLELVKAGHAPDVAMETNGGLGALMVPEIELAMREYGAVFGVSGVENYLAKVIRVRRLGGYLQRGQVAFRRTAGTGLLAEQLREFPNGDHDDGPDCLEGAVRRAETLLGVNS